MQKRQEIQNLTKHQLKDKIRIAFADLAEIHYKQGACFEALQLWSRSHDSCSSNEDYLKVSSRIIMASFECLSSGYLVKF